MQTVTCHSVSSKVKSVRHIGFGWLQRHSSIGIPSIQYIGKLEHTLTIWLHTFQSEIIRILNGCNFSTNFMTFRMKYQILFQKNCNFKQFWIGIWSFQPNIRRWTHFEQHRHCTQPENVIKTDFYWFIPIHVWVCVCVWVKRLSKIMNRRLTIWIRKLVSSLSMNIFETEKLWSSLWFCLRFVFPCCHCSQFFFVVL